MRCRGVTLIEVLAALAVMGGLLTAAVLVRGRLDHRSHTALRIQAAADAADRMVADWYAQDPTRWRRGVPRHGRGVLVGAGEIGLAWQTQTRPLRDYAPPAGRLDGRTVQTSGSAGPPQPNRVEPAARLDVVTLRVRDTQRDGDAAVLFDLELVLPTPLPPRSGGTP
ncbi:MAG: prepilin-type N-terminal cleavage/methylation domain-containing protein [Planctomycetota bacterium]